MREYTKCKCQGILWNERRRMWRLQARFFMEIMWPVLLFMGLVWLRRVNPLYRQHECEETTPASQCRSAFINQPMSAASLYPQATSLTRPCLPLGSCLGSKESSAMPITLVFNTPLVGNLLVWCPTTTTPCKRNAIEMKTSLTILGLELCNNNIFKYFIFPYSTCTYDHIWVFSLKRESVCAICGF